MTDVFFQVTLYTDGTITYRGKRPKSDESLGEALRAIADAADAGKITWAIVEE